MEPSKPTNRIKGIGEKVATYLKSEFLLDQLKDFSKKVGKENFIFVTYVLLFTIFLTPFLLGAISEIAGLLWYPLALAITTFFLIYWSISIFTFLWVDDNFLSANSLNTYKGIPGSLRLITLTLITSNFVVVLFSQMDRELYHLSGGFHATKTDFWADILNWYRFGIAQLIDNAFFDISTIYGWSITDIQATSFWSRTLVFLFNIELETIVIAVVLRQIQMIRKSSKDDRRA